MADHADFWVAIAAAAPVIVLAQVVALTTLSSLRSPIWWVSLAASNVLAQTIVLLTALVSLADGRDVWPTRNAIGLTCAGLLAVALTSAVFAINAAAKRREERKAANVDGSAAGSKEKSAEREEPTGSSVAGVDPSQAG